MRTLSKLASTAALALAATLVLSCSSDDGGDNNSSGGGGSGLGKVDCTYDGGTATIGDQTWMSENLNCNVAGSKCYDNDPANCAKYGRLYDWATAMNLPDNCNRSICSSRISAKHRGICPSGWHIPTYDEWETLSDYVKSAQGCSSCDANHLKATSGWNYDSNDLDTYGFAALCREATATRLATSAMSAATATGGVPQRTMSATPTAGACTTTTSSPARSATTRTNTGIAFVA